MQLLLSKSTPGSQDRAHGERCLPGRSVVPDQRVDRLRAGDLFTGSRQRATQQLSCRVDADLSEGPRRTQCQLQPAQPPIRRSHAGPRLRSLVALSAVVVATPIAAACHSPVTRSAAIRSGVV